MSEVDIYKGIADKAKIYINGKPKEIELPKFENAEFKKINNEWYVKKECVKYDLKEVENLYKEVIRLKSELECYENGLYFSSQVDELQEENNRLKEVIDKAIEYIENKARNNCWIDQYEASNLIKLLRGEDK